MRICPRVGRRVSGAVCEEAAVFEPPVSPFCKGAYPVKDAQNEDHEFPRRGAMANLED